MAKDQPGTSIISVLVDSSGSMDKAWVPTLKGLNQFLKYQQMRNDDCEFYLAYFSNTYQPQVEFKPVAEVAPRPEVLDSLMSGGTALFRSLDRLITITKKRAGTFNPSVTIVLLTDGGAIWTGDFETDKRVKEAMYAGWHFLWLAAVDQNELDEIQKFRHDEATGVYSFRTASEEAQWRKDLMAGKPLYFERTPPLPYYTARLLGIPDSNIVSYDYLTKSEDVLGKVGLGVLEATISGQFHRLAEIREEIEKETV